MKEKLTIVVCAVKKIVPTISSYFKAIKLNLTRDMLTITFFKSSNVLSYHCNAITALLGAGTSGVLAGVIFGLIIVVFTLLFHVLNYHFRFKPRFASNTWKNYLQYLNHPESVISTRGGEITFSDVAEAIDVDSDWKKNLSRLLKPRSLLERIKLQCFQNEGYYIIAKPWENTVEFLRKRGLAEVLTSKSGNVIIKVSLDIFLSQVILDSRMTSSFFFYIEDKLALQIYDYSSVKLIFNSLTLLFVFGFSCALGASLVSFSFFKMIGILSISQASKNVAINSLRSTLFTSITYGAGQLIPPQNCENLARRLEDANKNVADRPVISLERDSNGVFEVKNPSFDHSLNQIPLEESKQIMKLGDLESESRFAGRINNGVKRQGNYKDFDTSTLDSDYPVLVPVPKQPTYQRIGELVNDVVDEL